MKALAGPSVHVGLALNFGDSRGVVPHLLGSSVHESVESVWSPR